MLPVIVGLYGAAFCYALILLDLRRPAAVKSRGALGKPEKWLFGLWFVAAVFWGGRFATFRAPGFFDITIERVLFVPIGLAVLFDFAKGRWKGQGDFLVEFMLGVVLFLSFASMLRFGFTARHPSLPNPWFLFLSGYFFPSIIYLYVKSRYLTAKDSEWIFLVLFFIGFYLSVIAYFEFFNLRQYVYPRYINDPKVWLHLDRARGPYLNAAINGMMIIFGFLSGVYLYSARKISRKILAPALLIMVPSIYFTQTRSVYLSFLVCLAGLGFFLKTETPKWKVLGLPVAFLALGFIFWSPRLLSPERRAGGIMQVEEVGIRLVLIDRSLAMISEQPILGHGFGQFVRAAAERYKGRFPIPGTAEEQMQHNHLLGLWAELGIVGLAAYLVVIVRTIIRGATLVFYRPGDKLMKNMYLIFSLGLLVYIVNNNFLEPGYFLSYNAVFFTFMALTDNAFSVKSFRA